MAEFKLSNKVEDKDNDYDHYTITVSFDHDDESLSFEQNVILPSHGTEEAAQKYADNYEKDYQASHKE